MRVLIAGCGYVGTKLALQLAAGGHEVWGMRRHADRVPAPVRPLSADLLDPALAEILPAVDAVIYAASADASTPEAYRAAYIDGPRNVLHALAHQEDPVGRFLFTSSTAVWGDTGGDWVDEGTMPSPEGFRGELTLEGEEVLRSGPVPAVAVRLGGIYGPGRTRLIERVRSGKARCPDADAPDDDTFSNRIHRDDAAGVLAHLLTLEDPERIYVAVDDEPAPLCDVYRFVAKLLRVSSPTRGGETDRTRSNKRCSNERLKSSGYRFRYPSFREGYRSMVAAGTT